MKAIEWIIAWRYIRAKKNEGFIAVTTWFSLIGISLGVATLIIVMAVMNGFRVQMIDRLIGINGHIQVYESMHVMDSNQSLQDALKNNPNVKDAIPIIDETAMGASAGTGLGILVRGINQEDLKQQERIMHTFKGDMNNFTNDSIIIGNRLARKLNLKLGSTITIIAPKGFATMIGTIPRIGRFTVVGIFHVGMSEFDTSYTFIPMEAAKDFFQVPMAGRIEVFIKNPEQARQVAKEIQATTTGVSRSIPWQETHENFISALTVERNVMFLILTLIIIVAAFNIISGMIMLVRSKTKDIAIIRTIGATKGQVLRIFFIIGSSIGVVGTAMGTLLGLLICLNAEHIRKGLEFLFQVQIFPAEVYYLSQVPIDIRAKEVMLVVLIALALASIAALYPSFKAARVYPAESLRHD